jgi:1-phosphofructokinase family hexose kinase
MIVTVTANTTLDITVVVPYFEKNRTIRATETVHSMGGKPTDASWILGEIGIPSLALGFAAGAIGKKIENMLQARGATTDFIWVGGESRINTIIIGDDGSERWATTITTLTLEVSTEHIESLRQQYSAALETATCVVIGGTLPAAMQPSFYVEFIGMARGRGVPVIFDAAEPNLSVGLSARPNYIKPNHDELAGLAGRPVATLQAAYEAGREIQARYGASPIITLGKDGALAVLPDRAYFIPTLNVEVVSASGAGDAVLAGLAAAVSRGQPIEEGLRLGFAAATAVCLQLGTADCCRADVERFLPAIELRQYPQA